MAAALGLVLLCSGLYAGLHAYAPAAARLIDTLTPTPFLPATLTPTPFGPALAEEPTNTLPGGGLPFYTPTPSLSAPPWAPYAGPIYPPSIPVPTPAVEFAQGDDVMNVALLGIDRRPYATAFNTDTMIILSLNRTTNSAVMISFPRDLYVYIPGYGMDRLNAAFPEGYSIGYSGGGFGLFQDTYKYNFGLRIDHYALMDFSGFKDLIDNLGGIDVYAAVSLTDHQSGHTDLTIPAGYNHMDGTLALWYVRARYTTNDLDRNRRQQEVLLAIVQRLVNLNALGNLPGFFVTLSKYVESDLTLDTITPYFGMAASVSPSAVSRFRVRLPEECSNWITPEGKMVLLPNYDAIQSLLKTALNL